MSQPSARKELRTFRSLATLRVLNVIAVGSSLASGVGAVLAALTKTVESGELALASACTTLFVGMVWAALLRVRQTVGSSPLRWGWFASIPLAIGNAAAASALVCYDYERPVSSVLQGALIGVTIGVVVWLPALITTLAAFGLPIAWAQRRAEKGLAGEERGELVIGLSSSIIAVVSLFLMGLAVAPKHQIEEGVPYMAAFAFLGLITGALSTAFALRRESARRNFVQKVEEGAVQGYRVDATDQGKVLIRVTSLGTGYRVANFEEHLVTLDEEGEARRGPMRHQI